MQHMMTGIGFDDSRTRCDSLQFCSDGLLCLDEAFDSVGMLRSLAAATSMTPITPYNGCEKTQHRVLLCPGTPLETECMLTVASGCSPPFKRELSPGDKPKRKKSVHFEEPVITAEESRAAPMPKSLALPPGTLTPNTLAHKGFVVRGTFLVECSLPSPARRGSSHRSSSVPKNMGSDHFCQESPQSRRFQVPVTLAGLTPKLAPMTPASMHHPTCVFSPTPWAAEGGSPPSFDLPKLSHRCSWESTTPISFNPKYEPSMVFPPTPWVY